MELDDKFLSYISSKLSRIEEQIQQLEIKLKSITQANEKLKPLEDRKKLLALKQKFLEMEKHYNISQGKIDDREDNEEEEGNELESNTSILLFSSFDVRSIVGLIFLGKFLKFWRNNDEFKCAVEQNGIHADKIEEVINYYNCLFSLRSQMNDLNHKIQMTSNLLEFFCAETKSFLYKPESQWNSLNFTVKKLLEMDIFNFAHNGNFDSGNNSNSTENNIDHTSRPELLNNRPRNIRSSIDKSKRFLDSIDELGKSEQEEEKEETKRSSTIGNKKRREKIGRKLFIDQMKRKYRDSDNQFLSSDESKANVDSSKFLKLKEKKEFDTDKDSKL